MLCSYCEYVVILGDILDNLVADEGNGLLPGTILKTADNALVNVEHIGLQDKSMVGNLRFIILASLLTSLREDLGCVFRSRVRILHEDHSVGTLGRAQNQVRTWLPCCLENLAEQS